MSGFGTLLVANRGEVAVRVLRSARRLGLRTVAVFSEADRGSLHVELADEAVLLGPAPAAESYLRGDAVVEAALATGAGAVHPGYGFLSEDAGFARAVEAAGLAFVGPTPEQLEVFGTKHTARDAAQAAGVPLLPGTGLLETLAEAVVAAGSIGYPLMLKATAGGGGIGMRACADERALRRAWDDVRRTAGAAFSSSGVFLERYVARARHVEVQVFGDGTGRVLTLGDRDCSLQRRHQKVVEEAPAPDLPEDVRRRITQAAHDLAASVSYRSAGTVEYVYDPDRQEAAFLEVNTRLQVEHPVTEAVLGVDLVAAMLRLAQGETGVLDAPADQDAAPGGLRGVDPPGGAAVEVRVYAESADHGGAPSAGTVTHVAWPPGVRVDTWVEVGTQVATAYDPLLAKVVAHGADRAAAWARLREALAATRVDGVATNLGLLRSAAADPDVAAARHTTATLEHVVDTSPRVEVLAPGVLTTVQDLPGRLGLWPVGVPPSGPMDAVSFAAGNRALGNDDGAPGLESTVSGPTLRFRTPARVLVAGAPAPTTLDDVPVAQWEPVVVPAGGVLAVGTASAGMRTYVLVEGGLDVLPVLGSASTFDLGGMGGFAGRALRTGDVVPLAAPAAPQQVRPVPVAERPDITGSWALAALEGPHAAPEFFTAQDVETFYAAPWRVHLNSARTGVRLVGPRPRWARSDGGEAGLHPSNIHDTPYSVGAVDYTGDLPVLLGPDGPSLGGFTCPATVALGHRWKLGQLRPDDEVRFVPVTDAQAARLAADPLAPAVADRPAVVDGGVLAGRAALDAAGGGAPELVLRRSGDAALLVEYGPMRLDLGLRMRVHAVMEALQARRDAGSLPGVLELTPGIRSLQVHLDPAATDVAAVVRAVREVDDALPPTGDLRVPSRVVHLPLSWDDPAAREAVERYVGGVRDDAPWTPDNIEFIRRVNGLASREEVHRVVFDAEYLVLGLGDVYLGAPVATPLDPRHRLVTTKYNPARTWTPQNAVGIGGAYLCVYGMEGPGGYQLVGRTVPVWSTLRQRGSFAPGVPHLLRFFDRIRWYPVGADELLELRAEAAAGRLVLRVEDGEFAVADHERFLAENAGPVAEFRARQTAALAAEREAWRASGELDRAEEVPAPAPPAGAVEVPEGCLAVGAPFAATVFRVDVAAGDAVEGGQVLLAVEAMKTEASVVAPAAGRVREVVTAPGEQVAPGGVLVVLEPADAGTAGSGEAGARDAAAGVTA